MKKIKPIFITTIALTFLVSSAGISDVWQVFNNSNSGSSNESTPEQNPDNSNLSTLKNTFNESINGKTVFKINNANVALSNKNGETSYFKLDGAFQTNNKAVEKYYLFIEDQFKDIKESYRLSHSGGDIFYTDFKNQVYTNSITENNNSVFNFLNSLGYQTPKYETKFITFNNLLTILQDGLIEAKETQTGAGYVLEYDLDNVVFDNTILNNISLSLFFDRDYKITGIETKNGKPIVTSDTTISFKSDVEIINKYEEEIFDKDKLPEENQGQSNILTTLAKLLLTESYDVDLDASLNIDSTNIDIEGKIKADLGSCYGNFLDGRYQIALDHKTNGVLANSIFADYNSNTAYLKVNNLLKAKVSNTTINNLVNLISNNSSFDLYKLVDQYLNPILEEDFFDDLMSNGTEGFDINSILGDVQISNDLVSIKIDGNTLGINSDINIQVKLGGNLISRIMINFTLPEINSSFAFSLKLNKFEELTYVDYTQYSSITPVIPIFNTISKLINERNFKAGITFNSVKNSQSTSLGFNVNADLRNVDFENIETFLNGQYAIEDLKLYSENKNAETLAQKINGVYLKDSILYASTDLLQFSFKTDSIGSLFAVPGLKESVEAAIKQMEIVQYIELALAELVNNSQLTKDLNTILTTGSLLPLESFFEIEFINSSLTRVGLNMDYLFNNNPSLINGGFGQISLILNTSESSLNAINVLGINIFGNEISFQIELDPYSFKPVYPESTSTEYPRIDTLFDMAGDFLKESDPLLLLKKDYKLNLDGAILTNTGSLTKINGDINAKLVTDDISLAGKVDVNSNGTNHNLKFKYYDKENLDSGISSGLIIAQYNEKMHLKLNKSNPSDLIGVLKSIEPSNLLYPYIEGVLDFLNPEFVNSGVNQFDVIEILAKNQISNIRLDLENKIKSITLDLNSSLFGDTFNDTYEIKIGYSYEEKELIFDELKVTNKTRTDFFAIDLSLKFSDYDEAYSLDSFKDYNVSIKNEFLDMDNIITLLKAGIKTTEQNYFDLSGTFDLNANLFSWNIGIGYHHDLIFRIKINKDARVEAYIKLGNKKSLNADEFVSTEYFIREELDSNGVYIPSCYIVQTKCEYRSEGWLWNKKYYSDYSIEAFKVSQSELLSSTNKVPNIIYYLVDYALVPDPKTFLFMDTQGVVLGNIYSQIINAEASTEPSAPIKIEELINKAIYDNNSFYLDFALDKAVTLDGVTLKNVILDLTHDENNNLISFRVRGGDNGVILSLGGAINVGVDLHVYQNLKASEVSGMKRFNYLLNETNFTSNALLQTYRTITNISGGTTSRSVSHSQSAYYTKTSIKKSNGNATTINEPYYKYL